MEPLEDASIDLHQTLNVILEGNAAFAATLEIYLNILT